MQGRGGSRDPFSDFGGDPFGIFGGFGTFGPPRSLFPSYFGGRDPFDDPFFTRPFGSMFQSPFGPSGNPFPMHMHPFGFLENHAPETSNSRGPIIEELNSDDEKVDAQKKENPRKHGRSNNEPSIELPDDDEVEGKKRKHAQLKNEYSRFNDSQPQSRSFCFQSSTVTYSGVNGTYYTSSRTRRAGGDGVTYEECKEADGATGQASHAVSRGLHSKGHTLSRKLNSNGKVDTAQTLYNLNEDELAGFEEAWNGKARKCLPGWTSSIGASGSTQGEQSRQGDLALPSTEHSHGMGTIPETIDKVVGPSYSHERGRGKDRR